MVSLYWYVNDTIKCCLLLLKKLLRPTPRIGLHRSTKVLKKATMKLLDIHRIVCVVVCEYVHVRQGVGTPSCVRYKMIML